MIVLSVKSEIVTKEEQQMRKTTILLTAVIILAGAGYAGAQPVDPLDQIEGKSFSFSSGVGGWSTDLVFEENGSFTGNYHDSEMGDTGEGYPNGSVYVCQFSGKISPVEQVNDHCWKIKVDKLEKDEFSESIEDNIRYIPAEPSGITEGDEMLLYSPGTPVSDLSEDMQFWAHVNIQDPPQTELEDWFLANEENYSGFLGYEADYIANPWEHMTAEQLSAASGLTFGVPEGAEDVIYRYLPDENLAEMQFTIGSDEFCARIEPADEPMNISGMYFEWENEEEVQVGQCSGTIGQAQTGSEDWVELCQWYDDDQGVQYSLSVYTTEIDGLDLTALAEQIYKNKDSMKGLH